MNAAVQRFQAHRFAASAALALGSVLAQDVSQKDASQNSQTAPVDSPLPQNSQPTPAPVYTPLTLSEKYIYSVEQIFSGPRLLLVTARAAVDHVRDDPKQWGPGADSYTMRLAARFGRSFVRQNLAFGVRALDHEDPRYFPSPKKGGWERTKYAVVHTFWVRNDNGSMMPAYSRFAADYGMPLLAETWHPGVVQPGRAMRAGTISLGLGAGVNIATEFWPDLKKKLHLPVRDSWAGLPGH